MGQLGKTIYENKHYRIRVAQDIDEQVDYYQVINKVTGVIENGDTVLPKCISFAMNASEMLDHLQNEGATLKTPKLALPPSLQ